MLNSTQLAALRAAVASASACERATGCPAALSVAQWALESGWGRFSPGNNCFGIKYYSGAYGLQKLATHEYVAGKPCEENLAFATFGTLEACFEKHAKLITEAPRYALAWAKYKVSADVHALLADIAPVYAPANPLYVGSVESVMRMPQVMDALNDATKN